MNMQKNIQKANTQKNGPKRQTFISGLTKYTAGSVKGGKPLATLPSNSSVQKGKQGVGTAAKPSRAMPDTVKGNAKHRVIGKNPQGGAGRGIATIGTNASVAKGRMGTGGPARRVK